MRKVFLIMFLVLAMGGCKTCGGIDTGLAKSHEGMKVISSEVEPPLAGECSKRSDKCVADGVQKSTECKPLMECRTWKQSYAAGAKAVHDGLESLGKLVNALKKAKVIK